MTGRSRFAVITVFLAAILAFGATTYSAVNQKIYETIMIAYLNGYVDALKLDTIKIQELQGNSDEMRKKVLAEAEAYVARVRKMNGDEPSAAEVKPAEKK